MKQPAKQIRIDVPAAWGSDELSKFVDMAWNNIFASFALLPERYNKGREVDGALVLLCTNLSNAGDWFAPLFALKSHSCYRAAIGLAMAGQSPEAFMVMRGALESALYGLYIHNNKSAHEIWMRARASYRSALEGFGEPMPLARSVMTQVHRHVP